MASGVSASAINSHISALGTFASWAGFARPRTELVSYIIKSKGRPAAPPPKARVHDFPIVAAVRGLNSAIAALPTDPGRLTLLYPCVAFFALVWPARPHTLLSCRTASTRLSGNDVLFVP